MTSATAGDARAVGAVLGRAFTTDPVFGWLLAGRPRLEQRLTMVFTAFAEAADRTSGAQLVLDPSSRGASIWLPPDNWRASPFDVLRNGPRLLRAFGPNVGRSLRLLTRVEKHHPKEPHWYLEAVGCVPEARGKGVGPTLLSPVLDRCDTDGVPAYLESSNPRNIPFYERHGFVTMSLFPLPVGCPVITPMWRVPR